MGSLTVVQVFIGTSMDRTGWQANGTARISHWGNLTVRASPKWSRLSPR